MTIEHHPRQSRKPTPIRLAGPRRWSLVLLAMALKWLLGLPASAHASTPSCDNIYDPDVDYPSQQAAPSLELGDSTSLIIHIDEQRAAVELTGCLYELDGKPLELAAEPQEDVRLIFQLHGALASSSVVIVSDGVWDSTYAVSGGSFEYEMDEAKELTVFFAGPGQAAPVVPIVVRKPIEVDPDPA